MNQSKYIFAAIVTFLLWGFFSFGLRPIATYPPLDILFFRLYISVLFLVTINVCFRQNKIKKDWKLFSSLEKKKKKRLISLVIGGSLILMTNWLSYIIVMNNISVQAASLSYLVCPIITTLLSFILLHDHLTKVKWIAIIISFIACIILSIGHFVDLMYSLIVATSFALYIIIQRSLNMFDSFNLLMTQLFVVSLIMLPFAFVFLGEIPAETIFYQCILMIVILFTIIPMFLNNFALKGIDSSTVGILIYLNPITNFLLAIFYYHEKVSFLQSIGYLLIFLAIIVFNSKTILKLCRAKK